MSDDRARLRLGSVLVALQFGLFLFFHLPEFPNMKKSLLITAALLSTALAAQADELFVSIHSGAAMAQGAGLVLAGQALEQKVDVRVLLCDAAGDIAVNGQTMPTLKPQNVTPQQMLQGLIKPGVRTLAF